jgi:hypothetical protein
MHKAFLTSLFLSLCSQDFPFVKDIHLFNPPTVPRLCCLCLLCFPVPACVDCLLQRLLSQPRQYIKWESTGVYFVAQAIFVVSPSHSTVDSLPPQHTVPGCNRIMLGFYCSDDSNSSQAQSLAHGDTDSKRPSLR